MRVALLACVGCFVGGLLAGGRIKQDLEYRRGREDATLEVSPCNAENLGRQRTTCEAIEQCVKASPYEFLWVVRHRWSP
jgi:hypothetical protein